ncbi:MAG: adenylosuccinate synthase [Candidatus Sumerlaeia bacterium]|nr:adenylosuccinate synthase [Candidatus Sumerlaeia bacterium]
MKRIAIVGAQWGDEGKGKVVNYFSRDYQWVVRFSGGANAGHTIYFRDKKFVNHLVPSIAMDGDCKGFLSAGMVIDLEQLIVELRELEAHFPGISRRIYLDPEVFLVLPWHKQEDVILEDMRRTPIGTTRRGIGPAYTDKASRGGIKLYHLIDEDVLLDRLEELHHLKQQLYGGRMEQGPREVFDRLLKLKDELVSLDVHFTSAVEMAKTFREESVLFEGAQGVMLDLDFGTYPFVTSSPTMAHGVSTVGFSTFELDSVMGVLKAYTTRVGGGPFPTEDHGAEGALIRERGKEFGATTGRPRRCGWLDLPALRYVHYRSGLTSFIVTKADVLNGFEKVKVCVAYDVKGKRKELPATSRDFFGAEPVYVELPGWPDTNHDNFRKYLRFIHQQTGTPIDYISYGPRTEEMLETREWFAK